MSRNTASMIAAALWTVGATSFGFVILRNIGSGDPVTAPALLIGLGCWMTSNWIKGRLRESAPAETGQDAIATN